MVRDAPRPRVLSTSVHASWLDQAELLLRAFGDRYLTHLDVRSRAALVAHLDASWCEVQPPLRASVHVVVDTPRPPRVSRDEEPRDLFNNRRLQERPFGDAKWLVLVSTGRRWPGTNS